MPVDIIAAAPDWARDLDDNAKRLVASRFATRLDDIDRAYRHSHRRAQLMFCASGVLTCEVDDAIWIVPQQTAVWIPSGLPHKAFGAGDVECCSLLIEPNAHPHLPERCATLSISPLLRELILEAVSLPFTQERAPRDERLISLLLDEVSGAPLESLALPMPRDPRLLRLVTHLIDAPHDATGQAEWARRLGISERGLRRLFADQVGMRFGRWRHQLHVILAIRRMTAGESVQTISIDLGYENASSFVTMFKAVMGKPPARFMADHRARSSLHALPATLPTQEA